ncbi:MAG: 4'-phosphopantetheinyl transferase superfamily protein [Bacteroidales bacterium]|nr:4'-phosphopantetheinyl transferase superfamily protein [Bacteroidales bacterium]
MVEIHYTEILPEDKYESIRKSLMELLPPGRRDVLSSYRHPDSQQRSLLGDIMARSILSRKLDIPVERIRIATNPKGKPSLQDHSGLHFNISHAGLWVVCGIFTGEIGIDIEKIRKTKLGVAKRFFTPAEIEWLISKPPESRPEYFFRLWTLKESYLKYLGLGMTASLGSFSVMEHQGRYLATDLSGLPLPDVYLGHIPFCEGYWLGFCTRSEPRGIVKHSWYPEEFIR